MPKKQIVIKRIGASDDWFAPQSYDEKINSIVISKELLDVIRSINTPNRYLSPFSKELIPYQPSPVVTSKSQQIIESILKLSNLLMTLDNEEWPSLSKPERKKVPTSPKLNPSYQKLDYSMWKPHIDFREVDLEVFLNFLPPVKVEIFKEMVNRKKKMTVEEKKNRVWVLMRNQEKYNFLMLITDMDQTLAEKFRVFNQGEDESSSSSSKPEEGNKSCGPFVKQLIDQIPLDLKLEMVKSTTSNLISLKQEVNERKRRKENLDKEISVLMSSLSKISTLRHYGSVKSPLDDLVYQYQAELTSLTDEISAVEDEIKKYNQALNKSSDPEAPDLTCNICTLRQKTHALTCGHMFCEECANRATERNREMMMRHYHPFQDRGRCPNCNSNINGMPLKIFF